MLNYGFTIWTTTALALYYVFDIAADLFERLLKIFVRILST